MIDPISLTHDALWSAAEAHPTLKDMVRQGNRIKFDKRHGLRSSVQAGDVPELVLFATGCRGGLRMSSSSASLTRQFDWIITTGDMRIKDFLYPLSWALFEAMVAVPPTLMQLQWNNQRFVSKANTLLGRDGESNASRQSNVRGWSTVQSIEVDMFFKTSTLVQNASGA